MRHRTLPEPWRCFLEANPAHPFKPPPGCLREPGSLKRGRRRRWNQIGHTANPLERGAEPLEILSRRRGGDATRFGKLSTW